MIRIGKLGIERRTGKDLQQLRRDCWERDHGWCQECGRATNYDDGYLNRFDMAHIKSRGAGGSDVLENVRTLCHQCHMISHGCH